MATQSKRKRTKEKQLELPLPKRGGKRPGAGRKPKGERAGVSHRTRPSLEPTYPVHVTTRLVPELQSLRQPGPRSVLERCLTIACERFQMRIVHYSIQTNHIHLLVECADRFALSKAMQGLLVRFAKNLNKHWGRKGRVFADRYFARDLKSLQEIRNALVYVLRNAPRHGIRVEGVDECSSGRWFDGWNPPLPRPRPGPGTLVTCVPARHWPLRVGWKLHHPLIELDELPKAARADERHTSPIRPRTTPPKAPSATARTSSP
jgi:REP element-mobilizing transposase RayT